MAILPNRRSLSFPFLFCLFIVPTYSQSCQDLNQTGTDCVCLPGFTNSPKCDTLACGNRMSKRSSFSQCRLTVCTHLINLVACFLAFVDASKRPALNPSSAGSGGSKGCGNQCTTGFTGTACNSSVSLSSDQTLLLSTDPRS